MIDLLELASRCEQATGPDRELNRLIFATVSPGSFSDRKEAAQYADPSYRGNNADRYYLSTLGLPAYTASLDAAMTLVPEGCEWRMTNRPWHATIDRDGLISQPLAREAATPALALCAAALKARAASVDRSPKGQDAEERLDRNDESAVPHGDAADAQQSAEDRQPPVSE